MTEFKVWRTIVDWVESHDGKVYAACPPGSSVYDYDKFCIIDPESGKRDEPDILFSMGKILYIVECKPSLSASLTIQSSGESDVDKLHRIKQIYDKGNYNQQLLDNYRILTEDYEVKIAIGFASASRQPVFIFEGVVGFEVDSDCKVKMVGI